MCGVHRYVWKFSFRAGKRSTGEQRGSIGEQRGSTGEHRGSKLTKWALAREQSSDAGVSEGLRVGLSSGIIYINILMTLKAPICTTVRAQDLQFERLDHRAALEQGIRQTGRCLDDLPDSQNIR